MSLSFALCVALTALGSAVLGTSAMADATPTFWTRCDGAPPILPAEDPACSIPRGIATEPDTGDIYIADANNYRVVQLSVWGEFLRAWGWDVVAGGSGDDATPPEDEFEICVPASNDVCKPGVRGGGSGQFGVEPSSSGVALDSNGNVYVTDFSNLRVQKFDSSGNFLLMFGGDVNKTKVEGGALQAERNLCPVDPGDVCQAGSQGSGSGQFGDWPVGSFIAAGPDDAIYVGDVNRIQKFNVEGEYTGEIAFSGGGGINELPEPGTVAALAADLSGGDLYFAYESNAGVNQPDPQPNVYRIDSGSGEVLDTLEVAKPRALATDSAGNVYAFDLAIGANVSGNHIDRVLKFDPDGDLIDLETGCVGFACEELTRSSGLATSDACGIDGFDVYVANAVLGQSFVRAYGPQPDPLACSPPPVPPEIEAQFTSSVDTDTAVLQARINPHFWSGALGATTYYVQYGTATCIDANGWEAECVTEQPGPPGSTLGGGIVDTGVGVSFFLDNLQPATAYRYRFVAEGSGAPGEPVVGAGGKPGQEGKISTFTTFPPQLGAKTSCPNQKFRTGSSARLPDCRAFELVSPFDKEGADVTARGSELDQAVSDGEGLTYTTIRSIGDAEAAPLLSQYIARRGPDAGWGSEAISPPREGPSFWLEGGSEHNAFLFIGLQLHFKAFSEDLCHAWILRDTEPVLAPGAITGYPNIYRRDNCVQPPQYEAMIPVEPVDIVPPAYGPAILGFTADGSGTVFESAGKLTDDTPLCPEATKDEECPRRLYMAQDGQLRMVSVLPEGSPNDHDSPLGTASSSAPLLNRDDIVFNALAEDGSAAYWSADASGEAEPLYVRINPGEEPSELSTVTGTGNLAKDSALVKNLVAAEGKGAVSAGSPTVTLLETTKGQFVVGQPITGTGIPAGTTIVEMSGSTLTLSANATVTNANATIKSSGPMPFAVGQPISGAGIPLGTKIIAVAPGELTLSKEASETKFNTPLTAVTECSEPDKACTHEISAQARFWDATPDGKKAIYTEGSLPPAGQLREFDLVTQSSEAIADEVLGVVGASEDLARVYFASREALPGAGQNSEGDEAVGGEPNLYLYEAGGGGSFTYIATLAEDDVELEGFGVLSPIAIEPKARTSRVNTNGDTLAFTSLASLAGYDNADLASGEPDTEVFLYDAEADALRCVSCNPSGSRPAGRKEKGDLGQSWTAALIPPWPYHLHPSRPLSEDGERLFFESIDPLVLADTNGRQDVYEWERAESAADCGPEGAGAELYVADAGGCISLISGGQGQLDSEFLDASADGRDVFIRTGSSLLAHDPGLLDIYDAREGGGFPPPPSPSSGCEGEACQNPPPPPEDPTPASAAVGGAGGNVEDKKPPARCRKGKVRRRGRCVAKKRKAGKKQQRQRRKRANADRRAAR